MLSAPVVENEEVTILARQPGAPYVFYKEVQEDEIAASQESEPEEIDQDSSNTLSKENEE